MPKEIDLANSWADVGVVGAGLAGSEAAWQIAQRGFGVDLYEMRPGRSTEAHHTGEAAELVCSNSFKSLNQENAHGLLKAEMELQGSVILEAARAAALPAGQALAVDREQFSRRVTQRLEEHPAIRWRREEVSDLSLLLTRHRRVVVASGPLTSPALSQALQRMVGQGFLYFYDAIAPVVMADSINRQVAYPAARWDKGGADYLNCPLNKEQYHAFVEALLSAETVPLQTFEDLRHFEGCLPIEELARRGPMTLAHGPLKPAGLTNPATGRWPFAVAQLRQENSQATLWGLVGFQTKMTWPEQQRVLRLIPGLEQAEFARLGSMHRNTFLQSPGLLTQEMALKTEPRLHFAGQITGVEGYMESAAMGLAVGRRVAQALRECPWPPPPAPDTMIGALWRYVTQTAGEGFQPMNANFGLMDPPPPDIAKTGKKAWWAQRALGAMALSLEQERLGGG
ncbi:MAG: methylenetetrahydrofolate--tRNA-(uracil(54)-C(5))-methyltransferase (FADH(2)-oxidizing) TrmFO [Deltaproteobacteria bacterium]|nr:methylenetetrahydrofolate--tRNA-(uracil(54)-C(5))-methyltransferase (FADH(2)-oxidizing) TrmFO [Deltaproteobacteria bacterium]